MDENHLIDVIEVYKQINLNKEVTEEENELESDRDDDLPKLVDPDNVAKEITENSELIAMFWADEVSKCNYKEFGDIVSFDATFNSNKTTSRSESENSFFKSFTSPGSMLVNFMMSYESVMERERYRQEALDFKTLNAAPKCETKLAIEHHATRVYTRTIFLLVLVLYDTGLNINEGCETVIVRDKGTNAYRTLNTKNGKEQEKESEQWRK
ncbi:FAR1-related sequence 5-like protein [Tanacetum coccineum]